MSAFEFWGALFAIAVGAILIIIGGVRWATRIPPADDPIEHGDGEQ